MFTSRIPRLLGLECCLYSLCAICVFQIKSSTIIPSLTTKTAEEIKEALLKHSVIPDVIDKAPKHFLMALFRENNEMPELGNVLDPNFLEKQPYILNWPCDNTSLYTLIMTDPDSPSKQEPTMREWHHWLVGNIHVTIEEGNFIPEIFQSEYCNDRKCDIMSRYIRPYPKKGTGFHRYIFLVFKQPNGRIEFKEPYLSDEPHDIERANFSTRSLATKYNLGDPFAVSFFLSDWVKPRSTTTMKPWEHPTDYGEVEEDLYPPI